MKLPTICGRCNNGTLATWLLTAPTRSEITCNRHKPAVEKWVAADGGPLTTTPITQPDDAEPLPGHQTALFNL